jgi:hypothetical protein
MLTLRSELFCAHTTIFVVTTSPLLQCFRAFFDSASRMIYDMWLICGTFAFKWASCHDLSGLFPSLFSSFPTPLLMPPACFNPRLPWVRLQQTQPFLCSHSRFIRLHPTPFRSRNRTHILMLPLHGAIDRAGLTPEIMESGIDERAGLLRGLLERLDRDLIERAGDGVGVSGNGRRGEEGGEMTSTRVWCVSTPSTMRSKRIDNQTLYTGGYMILSGVCIPSQRNFSPAEPGPPSRLIRLRPSKSHLQHQNSRKEERTRKLPTHPLSLPQIKDTAGEMELSFTSPVGHQENQNGLSIS